MQILRYSYFKNHFFLFYDFYLRFKYLKTLNNQTFKIKDD